MIVSTNQPYFVPYPGFFHKAHLSDYFVLLDDVQFPRKTTWITRNRFKNDQGTLWLTIPVLKKGQGLQRISDVRISHDGKWQTKHLRSYHQAYSHAPYLPDHIEFVERILSMKHDSILDINLEFINYVMDYLGIESRMVRMSELNVTGKGQQLIIDICKALGAEKFLVQTSALDHYDPELFESEGLELVGFKKPEYIYPQMWGEFIGNLSIFDMLFTCGPKSRDIILRYPQGRSGVIKYGNQH